MIASARYSLTLLVCAATAALLLPLRDTFDLANIVMVFLLVVFLIAVRFGRGPAVLASFVEVGLFDFFFVPPHLTFAVADAQYLVTFAVMLAVGLVSAHLVAGIREQAERATRGEAETHALYDMARQLTGALTIEQVAEITQRFMADKYRLDSALFFADGESGLQDGPVIGHTPGAIETGFARTAFERGEVLEIDALAGSGIAAAYLPLHTSLRVCGVLAVSPLDPDEDALRAARPLLTAMTSLIAIAVERLHYATVAQEAEVQMASERLRNSILSALSHDLRTPLTSLVGLADSLTLTQPPLPEAARETAAALRDQARAMSRLLGNLLDMARLQAGRVHLRREWQPIEEVVGAAVRLLEPALAHHRLHISLPADLPLVNIDAVLMERVLGNLLENAAKYAPAGSAIALAARVDGNALEISVRDEGPGFPGDKLDTAFERFSRGTTESNTPGVGLGLAICKAIVDAHGGRIAAANEAHGGACVTVRLPLGTPPNIEEETS
ncbi:MAG: DUF4118 domain-containing protein [Rhodocyclaceae bacterium]|nr:DUF4118 domain-containing protein [Rhodocyclaceae bacterium]